MEEKLTVKDQIEINASKEKVWEVLTYTKYYKQWDELPEDFSEDKLRLGSIIEWEGYSKMTVRTFEPNNHLDISLYLPRVDLSEDAYDVSYSFKLSRKNDQTILTIKIGDFSPLPKAQDYYQASVEFADKAKKKIKELSEH
ncbi:SRPBCC domain-containing protein [Aliifodinibius sp. S!AR15-10]|uniref:SRPBCC family protein n=1 Tax=Aliifodinibius sp. S!AR15-10 TaxID=2950437 RepID=UPI00285800E7|nr:SRPBCC domain-containing protein [Aliifodinibius sp. S!AR15-10]MDR8390445.1 SRPBCC domain-containing protein [Aliifodinibius sp. S!AR15-10]